MSASGVHSASKASILSQSGIPSRDGWGGSGDAVPVTAWPLATPIPLVAKSKPRMRWKEGVVMPAFYASSLLRKEKALEEMPREKRASGQYARSPAAHPRDIPL